MIKRSDVRFVLKALTPLSKTFGGLCTIYGFILAFKASFLLGIFAVLISHVAPAFGLLAVFGRPDLCQRIAEWMKFAF